MEGEKLGFATRSIHAGYDSREYQGALNVPIFMTSTFDFETTQQGSDAFAGKNSHMIYSRLSNPTVAVLERRMADLEETEDAVAFASGMGAIAGVCWSFLAAGSHVVIADTLYGCTWAMFSHMKQFGIEVEVLKFDNAETVISRIRPNTAMVYFETPANPSNTIVDIKAVSDGAHSKAPNCIVVVDNTFAPPVITIPVRFGADVVVHSATKYISGHGDLIAGIACGSKAHCAKIRGVGLKDMTGAVCSPDVAHLLIRGLKTLELRMGRHSSNALAIAKWLESNKNVKLVLFPHLESHPSHKIALTQMSAPHGIVCFELHGDIETTKKMMDALQLCKRAVSLGDCETLIQHPASMTHATYSPEELRMAGISTTFVRISAGLENIEDIIADLDQAMSVAFPVTSEK